MWLYKDFMFVCEPIDIIQKIHDESLARGRDVLREIKPMDYAIMFTCPWHKNGKERKPSCGLITRKKPNGLPVGKVHCFACSTTKDLEEFTSNCFGVYDGGDYGAKWLKDNFQINSGVNRDYILDTLKCKLDRNDPSDTIIKKESAIKYVTEQELDLYRYYHPYMYERKMTNKTIEMYDIGYDKNTDCLTFPIHDENGKVLFIARRSVKTKYFNYPNAAIKPLYGVYQLKKYYGKNIDEVVVCESMINCITSTAYGRPAIALNGTGSSSQLDLLEKLPYRKMVLALDPDDAGRKGERKIFNKLKASKIVTKLVIPNGKDVNDLSKEEFDSLPEIFMSNVEQ